MVQPNGICITYAYDALGRRSSIITSDQSVHYILTYDRMGHIIKSQDLRFGTETLRGVNHFGDVLYEKLSNGYVLHNTYDRIGRRIICDLPDHTSITYDYDAYHLLAINRLNKEGNISYTHSYTIYDDSHHLLEEQFLSNIHKSRYGINRLGRRVADVSIYLQQGIDTCDGVGNVTQSSTTIAGKDPHIMEYSYDTFDHLLSEQGDYSKEYAYDVYNSRSSKDDISYNCDEYHQLTHAGSIRYDYDLSGNRSVKYDADKQVCEYTYDGLNRLEQVLYSSGEGYRLFYDFWGRCVSYLDLKASNNQWKPNSIHHYLYDDNDEVGEFPEEFRIIAKPSAVECARTVAIEIHGAVYAPVYDLYGNITGVFDQYNIDLVQSYPITAFGEDLSVDNDDVYISPWRFQGKRMFGDLIYFGHRFYDPSVGRWISPDPMGVNEGHNLYQFVHNNPLVNYDLYGLNVETGSEEVSSRVFKESGEVYFYAFRLLLKGSSPCFHFIDACSSLKEMVNPLFNRCIAEYTPKSLQDSQVYILDGTVHPSKDFFFINGMFNSKDDALASGRFIQETLKGHKLTVVHNASHGVVDIFDCILEKNGINTHVCGVLHEAVKASIDSGRHVILQAHSEGTLIAKRVLESLNEEDRQCIDFVGYGAVTCVDNNMAREVKNISSSYDLIPFLISFPEWIYAHSNIEFLKPLTFNPLSEHRLQGPTLTNAIADTNQTFAERRRRFF